MAKKKMCTNYTYRYLVKKDINRFWQKTLYLKLFQRCYIYSTIFAGFVVVVIVWYNVDGFTITYAISDNH